MIFLLPVQKKMLERKIAALRRNSRDSDSDDGMRETGTKNAHGN